MRSVDSASVWAPDVGPAVFPCLALTVALHSRLSNKTSRLHRCDLGRAACPPQSGGGPTECAPGSPCGRGSLRLREGVGFLPCFVVSLLRFLSPLGGGTRNCTRRNTTCSRPVRPMVMRVRHYTIWPPGTVKTVPCSLGCMTPRPPRIAVCTGPLGRNGE